MDANSNYENCIGFSRVVRVGDIIAVSGTAPLLANGETASPGDPYEQTKLCLEIMEKAVKEAGGNLNHAIRTRIYLKEQKHWADVARAHSEFFKDIKPACTFVVVMGFINDEWLVETEMDCVIQDKQALL